MVSNSILYKVRIHSLRMAWFFVAQESQSRASSEFFVFFLLLQWFFFSIFVGCAALAVRRREPPLPSSLLGGGRSRNGGALVSVGVGVCAGRGVVDPVQDDEAHAADHDHEAAYQEEGGLEGKEGFTHLADGLKMRGFLVIPQEFCRFSNIFMSMLNCLLTPIFCTDFMDSFLTSLM